MVAGGDKLRDALLRHRDGLQRDRFRFACGTIKRAFQSAWVGTVGPVNDLKVILRKEGHLAADTTFSDGVLKAELRRLCRIDYVMSTPVQGRT